MAGTLKLSNIQIGNSETATSNFVMSVSNVPAGSIKIARGNVGATTQDVLSIDESGFLVGTSLKQPSYTQLPDESLGTGTFTFNCSAGDMQQLTATGDITIAFSNFVVGRVGTFIIDAVNWGAWAITLPANMVGAGKALPTFTAAGTDKLMVMKDKDETYELYVIGADIGVMV